MISFAISPNALFIWTVVMISQLLHINCNMLEQPEMSLFNFNNESSDISQWTEMSDTVREVGMSKAAITLQKTQIFQRAVTFFLLNPQPNGAGFAGVKFDAHHSWNLEDYDAILINLRRNGDIDNFKVVLRHRNQNKEPYPTYEQIFTFEKNKFTTVRLPLGDFKPYYRGRELNVSDVGALDRTFVSSFGLQAYGGVYLPSKQSGVSSLEIDWIKAVK